MQHVVLACGFVLALTFDESGVWRQRLLIRLPGGKIPVPELCAHRRRFFDLAQQETIGTRHQVRSDVACHRQRRRAWKQLALRPATPRKGTKPSEPERFAGSRRHRGIHNSQQELHVWRRPTTDNSGRDYPPSGNRCDNRGNNTRETGDPPAWNSETSPSRLVGPWLEARTGRCSGPLRIPG